MSKQKLSPTNTGSIGVPPAVQGGTSSSANSPSIYEEIKKNNIKNAKTQFSTWIMGFGISILPLLALPIIKILEGYNCSIAFDGFFSNIEVLFIGISIAITALNDFIGKGKKFIDSTWSTINLVMIVLGVLIYGLIVAHSYLRPNIDNSNVLSVFTIIYLVIIICLGCLRYIRNILEQIGVI